MNLKLGVNKREEHVTIAEVESNGFTTPPKLQCPAPPPPTPEVACNSQANGVVKPNNAIPVAEAPKKKKKKSSGKNKKPNATGFEEFYADPPITPEEHEEEEDLYDQSRPFASRIQTCIQRYRARRKLDALKANIFTKYLILGGIEATGKAFTGGILDNETLEHCTAEEIATLQATDFIRSGATNSKYYDPANPDDWVVDFEGISKGFFSYRVPHQFGFENEAQIKLCSTVIRNFLNYVLQHAVCLEYTMDIMAARQICDLAEQELPAIKMMTPRFPGDWNVAASTICGGRFQAARVIAQAWQKEDPEFEQYASLNAGFEEAEAIRIFQTGLAFAGTDAVFHKAMGGEFRIVSTARNFYEVVGIERPSVQKIDEYARVKNHKGKENSIKALGYLKVKRLPSPGFDSEDVSDNEEEEAIKEAINEVETFWLEDYTLQLLFLGLKLELIVHELNIGVKFFDSVEAIYCSFFTYLENEMMLDWKEPVLNTRPPPTEDDPDIEERVIEAAMDEEIGDDNKRI